MQSTTVPANCGTGPMTQQRHVIDSLSQVNGMKYLEVLHSLYVK